MLHQNGVNVWFSCFLQFINMQDSDPEEEIYKQPTNKCPQPLYIPIQKEINMFVEGFSRPGWCLSFCFHTTSDSGLQILLFATIVRNQSPHLVRTRGHSFPDTPQRSSRHTWLSKGDTSTPIILVFKHGYGHQNQDHTHSSDASLLRSSVEEQSFSWYALSFLPA